jgi:nonsense-mediated mRNA decay protein 3
MSKNTFVTIPEHIDVEVCGHCGKRRKGKTWTSDEEELFVENLLKENATLHNDVKDFDLHMTTDFEDEGKIKVKAITHSKVHTLKAEEEHDTRVRIKRVVCPECSKQHGGYWEAKVQFRGAKRGLSEEDFEKAFDIVDTMVGAREKKDKDAFITKIEKIHDGLDFYFGSKNLGKAISKKLASEFGGDVKESYKLVGKKDGKEVYRTTYAVRAQNFRIGDFVSQDEKVFEVLKVSANRIILRALDSGENITKKPDELEKWKILGSHEIIKEMVLVSRSENEIQVLDPDSLKTVDVVIPEGIDITGEKAKIVKCEFGYFLVW